MNSLPKSCRCSNAPCSHADALLEVWMSAQLEPLRTCAASALCRMLRTHPGLAGPVTSRPAFIQQVVSKPRPLLRLHGFV